MKKFEYDEIEVTQTRIEKEYKCVDEKGYSLLDILKKLVIKVGN